jgi:hypothetical protein
MVGCAAGLAGVERGKQPPLQPQNRDVEVRSSLTAQPRTRSGCMWPRRLSTAASSLYHPMGHGLFIYSDSVTEVGRVVLHAYAICAVTPS